MGGKHEERLLSWSETNNNKRMQEARMKGEHMQSKAVNNNDDDDDVPFQFGQTPCYSNGEMRQK